MKPGRIISIVQYVFLAVGIGALVLAAVIAKHQVAFQAGAKKVQGTVVDFESHLSTSSQSGSSSSSMTRMYAPVVSFRTADGRQHRFVSSTSSSSPGYRRGEQVGVMYAPGTPEKAQIDGFMSIWLGVLIAGILGAVFFLVGGGLWFFRRRKASRKKALLQNGMAVSAKIKRVEINEGFEVNGRSPWRIVAQWQDPATKKIHLFNSDNLWFDPGEYIADDTVKVYMDRKNHGKYTVDTSFLPELAG